jgi:hypothetical protein
LVPFVSSWFPLVNRKVLNHKDTKNTKNLIRAHPNPIG